LWNTCIFPRILYVFLDFFFLSFVSPFHDSVFPFSLLNNVIKIMSHCYNRPSQDPRKSFQFPTIFFLN
jgi:hypothetical protein